MLPIKWALVIALNFDFDDLNKIDKIGKIIRI